MSNAIDWNVASDGTGSPRSWYWGSAYLVLVRG